MHAQFAMEDVLSVGIDPHRATLDVVGVTIPETILYTNSYDNTPTGHRRLLQTARAVAAEHGLKVIFGLEDSGHYGYRLGRFLAEAGCHVKEVNPRMTNRQRDFYGQDKTDEGDARAIAAIVLRMYNHLPDVTAVQEATEATRTLSRYRERLVQEQTAAINQLHRYLDQQYPDYKSFFSEINGVTALQFWMTYPTPAYLQDVSPAELAQFLAEQSNRRLGKEKAQQISTQVDAEPTATPGLLVKTQAHLIRDLAQRLLQLRQSIKVVEQQLEQTIAATGQQLTSFKGLSTVLAGVFIGETLTTSRFANDKDKFAKYNGSAPATRGSGEYSREISNQWCNRRLKDALDSLALNARKYQPLSKQYYQQCLDRGLPPEAAKKCLMRRLSDVIFAMMRDQSAYDLDVHRRKQAKHKGKGKHVAPAAGGG